MILSALRCRFSLGRVFLLAALALAPVACQRVMTHQAYAGPQRPAAEVATFVVPKEFELSFVGDQAITIPLLQDGAIIKVLPGPQRFVVYYQDFWNIGGDNQEKFTSQPMQLTFNAQAGETYTFTMPTLQRLDDVRAYIKTPTVTLVDGQGKAVADAQVIYNQGDRNFLAGFAPATPPAASPQAQAESPPATGNSKALEMLQYWWREADPAQRAEFLRTVK